MDIKRLFDVASDSRRPPIININSIVQSLVTHAKDILTDSCLLRSNLLDLNVTLIYDAGPLNMDNFRWFHQLSCEHRVGNMVVIKRNDIAFTIFLCKSNEKHLRSKRKGVVPRRYYHIYTNKLA